MKNLKNFVKNLNFFEFLKFLKCFFEKNEIFLFFLLFQKNLKILDKFRKFLKTLNFFDFLKFFKIFETF